MQLAERYGGIGGLGRRDDGPALLARRGRGPATHRSSGASRWARTSAARATRWSCTGRPRVTDAGGLRSQFTHVTDVAPTILDVVRHPAPVDGRRHRPGAAARRRRSPTRSPTRRAPERHTQQYFETIGNRAMYKDGWWLAMRTERIPWVITRRRSSRTRRACGTPTTTPSSSYYLPDDFSQAHDLAAEHPDKVQELRALFWSGGREVPRAAAAGDPLQRVLRHRSAAAGRVTTFEFRGDVAERPVGHDPADLQPLVHDQRRPGRPRGRCAKV